MKQVTISTEDRAFDFENGLLFFLNEDEVELFKAYARLDVDDKATVDRIIEALAPPEPEEEEPEVQAPSKPQATSADQPPHDSQTPAEDNSKGTFDTVCEIMESTGEPMSAIEIHEMCVQLGYDIPRTRISGCLTTQHCTDFNKVSRGVYELKNKAPKKKPTAPPKSKQDPQHSTNVQKDNSKTTFEIIKEVLQKSPEALSLPDIVFQAKQLGYVVTLTTVRSMLYVRHPEAFTKPMRGLYQLAEAEPKEEPATPPIDTFHCINPTCHRPAPKGVKTCQRCSDILEHKTRMEMTRILMDWAKQRKEKGVPERTDIQD